MKLCLSLKLHLSFDDNHITYYMLHNLFIICLFVFVI